MCFSMPDQFLILIQTLGKENLQFNDHCCITTVVLGKRLGVIKVYRLPLPEHAGEVTIPEELVLLMEGFQNSPVNADQIQTWSSHDPTLSKVKKLVLRG